MSEEADRLVTAALRDHARIPAPPALRAKLERKYLAPRRRWVLASVSALSGAIASAAIVLLLVRPSRPVDLAAREAVGDAQPERTRRGQRTGSEAEADDQSHAGRDGTGRKEERG